MIGDMLCRNDYVEACKELQGVLKAVYRPSHMRLTKRHSLVDSSTRNGGLSRLRANLQSKREHSEVKKRFACDLLSLCCLAAFTVLSRYFHHTGTPFAVAKYPQVKWSSLSPRSRGTTLGLS
jgi:hypothetical protein